MAGPMCEIFGEAVSDAEEEAFLLFSQEIPSRSLGFVDSKATKLEIKVGDLDLEISQSPTLLSSNRDGGTTGAVLWSITPLLATWMASITHPLNSLMTSSSTILELGCGISGILPMVLSKQIAHYVATDQPYVLKLLRENIAANQHILQIPQASKSTKAQKGSKKMISSSRAESQSYGNIQIIPLDWETSDLSSLPSLISPGSLSGIDLVIACDCIYNDALIEPFVRTCADICRLRRKADDGRDTVCLIAQQLRSAEVMEDWLKRFMHDFTVWRVPDEVAGEDLGEGSGFVLHVGVLKV